MIKRTPKPEPHVTIERRKYIATCPACTRHDVETTALSFGPSWMAMRIKLCDVCLGELHTGLSKRVKT